MFRYRSQALVITVTCASLTTVFSLGRTAYSVTDDGSIAAKSDAQFENPATAITTPTVPEKGTAVSDDAATGKAADALQRRAGEQIGNEPKGRALALGMYLQEADSGRVRVVEVGPATPAFDAGMHEGDEILSYHGFSADSYRKWIDGIRKLTTDAPADSRIPVVVSRDGKRMALQIRVPMRTVRTEASRALAQGVNQQSQTALGPNSPLPIGPTGAPPTGGNNVLINNTGPFGEFFGDQTSGPNERAMAQIFRLNGRPPTKSPAAPTNAGQTGAAVGAAANSGVGAAPAGGGMRIGLAGFRDDPAGMVVMVDVGALAPGNYIVGIGDPSVMGAMGGGNPVGNVRPNPNIQSPQPRIQSPQPRSGQVTPPAVPLPNRGDRIQNRQGGTAAPQGTPAVPPTGVSTPQSSLQSIPRTVLAQVAASGTSSADSEGSGAAAASPGTTFRPTGPSSVNNTQRDQATQTTTGLDQTATGSGTDTGIGVATLNEIGTLTVDQSGTGRMQQTVEGVQVRNVVGQAIVLFSQGGAQPTLPANLNGAAGTATRQGVVDSGSARGSQGVVGGAQAGAVPEAGAAGQATPGARLPVAAGIIRLISDRRPPITGADTTATPSGVNPGTEQPATATPTPEQNIVR